MIWTIRTLAVVAVGALVGCGTGGARQANYASLGLVEVTGTVTLDSQPLVGAHVKFENPATQTYSHGTTNENGAYRLTFNSEKSGCTPGDKIVRITGKPVTDNDDPDDMKDAVKLPAKYNRKSELKATVDADHKTFDFALSSK